MARGLALTCIAVLVALASIAAARSSGISADLGAAVAADAVPASATLGGASSAVPGIFESGVVGLATSSSDPDVLDPAVDLQGTTRAAGETGVLAVAETQAAPETTVDPAPTVAPARTPAPQPARTAAPAAPVAAPVAPVTVPAPTAPTTCPTSWFCYPRLGIAGPIVPYTDCSGGTDVGTAIRSYNCLSDHYLMGHAYTQFGLVRQWVAGDIVFAWGQRFTVSGAVTQQSCGAPSFPLATLSMQTSLTSSACGAVLVVQAR